jgi:lipopolysaccharide transport system permease protein
MTIIENRCAGPVSPVSVTRRGARAKVVSALIDFKAGLALWRVWARLGWNDILQRYRRSVLGPFWLTASMGIMVLVPGVLYAKLFKSPIDDFLPFLCVGLPVWTLISSFFTEGGTLFIGAESYIKQIRLPYSVYVYRSAWSKLIIFAHNSIVYLAMMLYFGRWPGAVVLLAIPALLLVLANGALAGLVIGMASARFRDIPQIIISSIQIVFFVTPIMWKPELLQNRSLFEFNPFYQLVEIVRAPLLGATPSLDTCFAVLLISLINIAISGAIFIRFRARIAYWV